MCQVLNKLIKHNWSLKEIKKNQSAAKLEGDGGVAFSSFDQECLWFNCQSWELRGGQNQGGWKLGWDISVEGKA